MPKMHSCILPLNISRSQTSVSFFFTFYFYPSSFLFSFFFLLHLPFLPLPSLDALLLVFCTIWLPVDLALLFHYYLLSLFTSLFFLLFHCSFPFSHSLFFCYFIESCFSSVLITMTRFFSFLSFFMY